MKKIKVLPLVIAALSLGFASCSSERAIDLQEGGVELSLTTSIQDQSRVTTQTDNSNHWDADDAIGVFSSTLKAENVEYTANQAGATTDFVGGSIMIPASPTTAHAVQAYYPFTAGTESTINIDLATQNDQPVLWASGTVTYAQPVINLKFAHKLAKLRIKINTEGTEAPTEEVTDISVVEALAQGTLDVVSGDFTVGITKAPLNLNEKDGEYYSYIIPGQKINEIAIKIVHGGKTYNAQLVAEKIAEAGKYYLYTIKLNNDKTVQIGEGDANNPIDSDASGDEGELIVTPEADTTPEDPAAAEPVTATLSETALNAEAAGQIFNLTLTGFEGEVTADGAPAWVTITGLNTTGTPKNLKVTVAENTDTTERTATITLKAEGMKDVSFTVTQEGAVEEAPAENNWLFPDNKLIDVQFDASLNGKVQAGAGKNGGEAIVVDGSSSSSDNSTNWRVKVPAGMKDTAKALKFWIKVNNTTKDLVLRLANSATSFQNRGFMLSEAMTGEPVTEGSFTYGTAVPSGDWVQVTLDLTSSTIWTTEGDILFEVRHGKGGIFNYVVSDFEIFY